jgi:GTPase SAR1 family protein
MADSSAQVVMKVLVLGDQATGKTSIIKRSITNSFSDVHKPTIGVDFHYRKFEMSGTNVGLQLWDIAGAFPERRGRTPHWRPFWTSSPHAHLFSSHFPPPPPPPPPFSLAQARTASGPCIEYTIATPLARCSCLTSRARKPFTRCCGCVAQLGWLLLLAAPLPRPRSPPPTPHPLFPHPPRATSRPPPSPAPPVRAQWKREIDSKVQLPNGKPLPVVLLANKCDLPNPAVNKDQLDAFCKEHGFVCWFETSAKDNKNIEEAVKGLVANILSHPDALQAQTEQKKVEEAAKAAGGTTLSLGGKEEAKASSGGCC